MLIGVSNHVSQMLNAKNGNPSTKLDKLMTLPTAHSGYALENDIQLLSYTIYAASKEVKFLFAENYHTALGFLVNRRGDSSLKLRMPNKLFLGLIFLTPSFFGRDPLKNPLSTRFPGPCG